MHDGPSSRLAARNFESILAEIAQEKAAALGRTAGRLEEALRGLAEHEATHRPQDEPARREQLVFAAAEALWYHVIQREACGLTDVDAVLRHYAVPRAVYARMGARPASPPPPG